MDGFEPLKKVVHLNKTPEDNFAPDGKITTMAVGPLMRNFPLEQESYSETLFFHKLCLNVMSYFSEGEALPVNMNS